MEVETIPVILGQSPEWENMPNVFMSIIAAQALRTKNLAEEDQRRRDISIEQQKAAIKTRPWQISTIAVWKTLKAPNEVISVAVSPDGLTVASGSNDASIILWEISTGTRKRLHGNSGVVLSLPFSPDGQTLAAAANSKEKPTVRLWDISTGMLRAILNGHSEAI